MEFPNRDNITTTYLEALVGMHHAMSLKHIAPGRKGINALQAAFILSCVFPGITKDVALVDLIEIDYRLGNNSETQEKLKRLKN